MSVTRNSSKSELVAEINLLRRDVQRLVGIAAINLQLTQLLLDLDPVKGASITGETADYRYSPQGVLVSVYANAISSFPVPSLEALFNSVVSTTVYRDAVR